MELVYNGFLISDDSTKLQLKAIHQFLSTETYWAEGVPFATVERAIRNSLSFGVYNQQQQQIGFARWVTDRATFAYLCDVYIEEEEYRGLGLSKKLMETMMQHHDLQGLRRFMLATKDAHGLYAQYGFTELADPSRIMAITNPNIYKKEENS